ncbi:hypothetical protein GGH94_000144 [Coemansia aciculifera]|uniref:BHLH domain-containing protein n=1 Tax=Coemansia aciculifera TaxID=417176 RepID=A0A9W8M9E4_9FUNG|nr:hypothetical protein GGH94_000144 [Coemansia aciculifera]
MDRRVSLPSFQEIAGALPKPAALTGNATSPQPIPQKVPVSSPHYNDRNTSEYGSPGYYQSDNRYAIYSNRPPSHQRQQQAYASSYPRQDGDFIPSPPLLAQSHPIKKFDTTEPAHRLHGGVISLGSVTNGQQARIPPRNVHVVAQMGAAAPASADPIRSPTHGNAFSLPHSATSFMHSPPSSSSRFAPYHMSSPAASSAETGATRVPSSLSPAYKHGGGIGSPPSRVSDIVAQQQHYQQQHQHQYYQQQQQYRPAPVVSSPPAPYSQHTSSNMSVSPLTLAAKIAPSSTQSNHQRELSVPELVEEDNMDYDDNTPQNGMAEDGSVDGGMSTAKIRTIHKLAERRRRREMKNLFDTLRKCLPIDKSIRLSKWEVLKKAIEVISTQDTEIRMLRLGFEHSKNQPQ